jgi:hypothetical protein
MVPVPLHLLTLDLFAIPSKRLEKRRIAHGKEDRVFCPCVFMTMPRPGGYDEEVSPPPLKLHVSDSGNPTSLNHMVLAYGSMPVSLGFQAWTKELDATRDHG